VQIDDRLHGEGNRVQYPGEGLGRTFSRDLTLLRLEEQVSAEGQEIYERVHIALLGSTGSTRGRLAGGEAQPWLGPGNGKVAAHKSVKVCRSRSDSVIRSGQ
jgi:hypothetical protein